MNISFAATKEQIKAQTKTVTRRMGWVKLSAGRILQPVEKCQGLKKGENVKPIGCPIRVVSVSREPLKSITDRDVIKEGFPGKDREWFMNLFGGINKLTHGYETIVTRIEFEYMEAA